MALPALIFVVVFNYLPMIGAVVAFKRFRYDMGILGSPWVGFRNFEFFFTSDAAFVLLRNTVLYSTAFFVINTTLAITFAVLLYDLPRGSVRVYQTVMFLPHFLSWVVVSYITTALLDANHGYLNRLLAGLGAEPVRWYFEPRFWPAIIPIVNTWKSIGFATLIYFAGIMGIDPSYFEAAEIEGATKAQTTFYVTVPFLMPILVILLIIAIGNIFRGDFGLFFFIPNNSAFLYRVTDIIETYVYRALTQATNLGMGAAVGLFQSVLGLIAVVGANSAIRRVAPENSLW